MIAAVITVASFSMTLLLLPNCWKNKNAKKSFKSEKQLDSQANSVIESSKEAPEGEAPNTEVSKRAAELLKVLSCADEQQTTQREILDEISSIRDADSSSDTVKDDKVKEAKLDYSDATGDDLTEKDIDEQRATDLIKRKKKPPVVPEHLKASQTASDVLEEWERDTTTSSNSESVRI